MSIPILTTKLYKPRPSAELVPRRLLIKRLNRGLDRKLTLVSAPAGFGKTTLISEWSTHSQIPFCWVTLDESDNDISRFLAYLIASMQSIDIVVEAQLLTLLRSPQQLKIETILIPLINQIANSPDNFVLVLDDYHVIQSREIHTALTYILDHQPLRMHLVIITRADPPLGLARLRGHGQMTEIRAADLRFSAEEGEALLNAIGKLNLTSEELASIINRTDGWVTAIKLISLALSAKTDRADYIQDFSGSQTYIAEYLTDEVIKQQPTQIQEFLLKTSILDRLSGPLCDVVIGQQNSQKLLERLWRENLFISALDDGNQWFRYHRLFANLLQQRLAAVQPGSLPSLYLNASNWFESSGFPNEAIDYALRGKHYQQAVNLVDRYAKPTIIRSEVKTFIHWIEKLPGEVVDLNSVLCILYAWAVLVTEGQSQVARNYLAKVNPGDEHTASQLKTVQAILCIFDGHASEAIELCREALDQLPGDDYFFRTIAAWNLSGSLAVSGEIEAGLDVLKQVTEISLASQNYLVAIIALCRRATFSAQMGKLHHAKELFEQAIAIATHKQEHPLPAVSEAYIGVGKVYWEWNQHEIARKNLLEAIAHSKRWREFTAIDSYVTLAQIYQNSGDNAGANQMITAARKLAEKSTATESDDKYVASQQAHLWIRQNNLQSALRWAAGSGLESYSQLEQLGPTGKPGRDVIRLYELIVYARLLIAEKQLTEAIHILHLVLPTLEDLGYAAKIIEAHLLIAITKYELGDTSGANSALKKAICTAELEGYTRIFLDEGTSVVGLLQELIALGEPAEFADSLLKQLGRSADKPITDTALIEPLSERELEVLRMLKTELNAPEIADHLHIAVTTMRTHTKNIYSKLEVHSRFEAVVKAEELNLLS